MAEDDSDVQTELRNFRVKTHTHTPKYPFSQIAKPTRCLLPVCCALLRGMGFGAAE